MTIIDGNLRDTIIGSLCIALSQLLFASNDVIIKISNLKISQLLISKYIIQLTIAILWWMIKRPSGNTNWYGDKPYIMNIWIRGIMYSIAIIFQWYAVIKLPIGDAYCIQIQGPLIIAVGAAMFLKEKLPKLTPVIAILAVIGIILIAQPTFITVLYYQYFGDAEETEDIEALPIDGIIFMILAIITFTISILMIRTAKEAHFLQLEIVASLQSVFISSPILMLINHFGVHNDRIGGFSVHNWRFDSVSCVEMLVLGVFGFGALSLNVIGFQSG